ncbi:chromate transporter [Helcococcus massiliensis]|uniref:chromate transporter n=1 Tax=Helcococcus massiliensis TaxID=2040290 RepID=UPI000CDE6D67|nr:chromate transporter [Helcococcus massiliensis]
MKIYLELFITFFQIGLFTFGGGYAMLPLLERELVDKRGWVSKEEILDYYAIGQATPGIIAVNTSTFCGVKKAGYLGGIVASFGFITPSIIIITLIANFLKAFSHLTYIQNAFAGIRVAVCALVLNTVINLVKKNANTGIKFIVFALTFIAIAFLQISPVLMVIGVGILGILFGRR